MPIVSLIFMGLAFAGHLPKQDLGFLHSSKFCKLSHLTPDVHLRCDNGDLDFHLKIHPLPHPIGQKKIYDLLAQKHFPQLTLINCSSEDSIKCVYSLKESFNTQSAIRDTCLALVVGQKLVLECNSGYFIGPKVRSFAQAMVQAQKLLSPLEMVHCSELEDRGPYCEFLR